MSNVRSRLEAVTRISPASGGEALLALIRREHINVLLPLGAAATEAACARRAEFAAITSLKVPTVDAHRTTYVKSAFAAAYRARRVWLGLGRRGDAIEGRFRQFGILTTGDRADR